MDPPPLEQVDVLLVDDNESWARATGRLLEANRGAFDVETVHSLDEGSVAVAERDPDCVVCDYQLGDGTGLDLLAAVRERDPDRPFVLVTGRGSETVASDAIGRGVTDYIRKDHDDEEADLLASRIENAVRNYRTERALQRQRRSKNAMLDILTATTIETELHHQFCAQLVEDRGYACAWIGSDEGADVPVPEAVVGHATYVDSTVRSDADAVDGEPSCRALRRDEAVVERVADGADADPADGDGGWRAKAREHGFAGAIAAPIRYDGVRFGVLAVYAADATLLGDRERRAIVEYAETIGYALRAAERKRSLMADAPVRIAVEIEDPSVPALALARALPGETEIEIPSAIPRKSGETLYVAYAEGTTADVLESTLADLPSTGLAEVHDGSGTVRSELLADAPTPEAILASHGARFEGTVVEHDVATVTLTVPDDGSIQSIVDSLETTYEEAAVSTVWTERADAGSTDREDPLVSLTDRQREVLQHAYHVGYFDQPRGTSATELAAQLDIARATATQHLRSAQRKVFGELLPGSETR